jgi:hypothetical protein
MTPRSGVRLVVAALALAVLSVTGCSQLPVEGPIVETRSTPAIDEAQPMEIDPVPPEDGASQPDVVTGFLDAMTAWPQRLDVAKQFLSRAAQASWSPDQATITYLDVDPPTGEDGTVNVRLVDPERIDSRGAWQGPEGDTEMSLELVVEDGEYRIANPPDAQYVPSDWFADRYRQANLYFLDRTRRILVPEPVFVPRGEQLATTLVSRLLAGPPDDRIETTAFPPGLSVELSVPVSREGVADIELEGAEAQQSPAVVEKMLAQLAWTLRQEDITSLRLSISGQEVPLPGGVGEFGVDSAPEYAPTGYRTSKALFGIRDGVLVSGDRDDLAPVGGPLGREPAGIRAVAVSLGGATAAVVREDGRRVLLAPVGEEAKFEGPGGISTIAEGGSDFLPPAWDFAERLWLVDRRAGRAEVSYVDGDLQRRTLDVPGVTGQRVKSFLVSRDGTRFVAVVRQDDADQLRVGRILAQDNTRVLRALRTETISLDGVDGSLIKDIAWTSTTTIAVLSSVDHELFDVQTVAVDGAPTETSSVPISGRVIGLAGTPAPESRQYAVTRDSLIELTTLASHVLEPEVASLGYVG